MPPKKKGTSSKAPARKSLSLSHSESTRASASAIDHDVEAWLKKQAGKFAPHLSSSRRANATMLALRSLEGASGDFRLASRRLERALEDSYNSGPQGGSAVISVALKLLLSAAQQRDV